MGTNKITKREEIVTKQLLLESAEKFFLEYGYQAAPLRRQGLHMEHCMDISVQKKNSFMLLPILWWSS